MSAIVLLTVSALGAFYTWSAQDALDNSLDGLRPPPYILKPERKVSLVTPAYKEEKYIGNLITSAWNQTYPIAEVIVADASKDNLTRNVAESLGAKVYTANYGNIGESRNIGAGMASGDILVFADCDVILGSSFVEHVVGALEHGAICVHPQEAIYDSTPWHLALWAAQLVRPRWNTSRCVGVWTEAFHTVGGYDITCLSMGVPLADKCREDLLFAQQIAKAYGWDTVRVLPALIATSARRYKAFGTKGWEKFDETPRRYVS